MNRTDVLLFGGSFDPPHQGHFQILQYAIDQKLASFICIVPAVVSPFKLDKPPAASSQDRFAMLELLLKEVQRTTQCSNEKLQLMDIEIQKKGISYTAHTCLFLRNQYPTAKIDILIGSDSLVGLENWEAIEEIASHHSFWVYPRKDLQDTRLSQICDKLRLQLPQWKCQILSDAPPIACSSIYLRKLLSEKTDGKTYPENWECLSPTIYGYIQAKGIYI